MLSLVGCAAFSQSNSSIQLVPLPATAPPLRRLGLPSVDRWGFPLAAAYSDSEDSEDTKLCNAGLNPTTSPFVPVHSDDPVTAANRHQ